MNKKTTKSLKTATPSEGLRARKRRQTRERIVNAALQLFSERDFDSVTVDEIAAAADVSKRSFFDYFPTKEDVIFAWQDEFGKALAAAIAARPAKEPLARTIEEALTSSLAEAANPASLAVDRLIRNTPALRERDYVKYARLEQTLAGALMERERSERGRFRARLLAAIVIAGMRLGNEQWYREGKTNSSNTKEFTKRMFRLVWNELYEIGGAGKRQCEASS